MAAALLVEAESFATKGGWVVDPQFVEQMGSPFLLAHGLGKPVSNAVTTVTFPSTGTYRLWVRTRDWIPDHPDSPGRFKVIVNGRELPVVFGTHKGPWAWQDGGKVEITRTNTTVELKDLTGFDGRCDALVFTQGSDIPERPKHPVPNNSESYDVVVVGGGIAGCAASIAAASQGLHVALIHDRLVFGGNASEEVRVRTEGRVDNDIVESLRNVARNTDEASVSSDINRQLMLETEITITLVNPWRAYGVVTNGPHIVAVDARHIETGEIRRFNAPLFIDCTGDGWIGYWAGADFRVGREAALEFGESRAPKTADRHTLGSSLMWTSEQAEKPVPFPAVPWALKVAVKDAALSGDWDWEYGIEKDTINDAEEIRDHLLRAIYGNFFNAKQKPGNERRELHWVPYIAGKRESRRLMGDYVLTEKDIISGGKFEDVVALGSWTIDLHEPVKPGSYRTKAVHTKVGPYGVPYRCLYSRNIKNLLMAGRCLSASHVGLGGPRVQHTTGQMGVAVGYATALCKKHDILPRDVYRNKDRLHDLQKLIGAYLPVPASTNTFAVTVDSTAASDMAPWAEKMRQAALKEYPVICAKLGSQPSDLSITLTKEFPRNKPGATKGTAIQLSVGWGREHPKDTGCLMHELTHAAQRYPRNEPLWLVEGMAEYVRFWMYETPEKRPHVNPKIDSYRQGYIAAGALLAWIEKTYDKNIIPKVNAAIQQQTYTDELFRQATGKSLDELWQEFCASIADKSSSNAK